MSAGLQSSEAALIDSGHARNIRRGTKMKKFDLALLSVGVLVAAVASAAKPVKPVTATATVPVIADANGVVVGPLVPLRDTTRVAAALHRYNGQSIKVFFDDETAYESRVAAAADLRLKLVGAVRIYYPVFDCQGPGYVYDGDLAQIGTAGAVARPLGEDFRGYAPMMVLPAWPGTGATRPTIVSVSFTPDLSVPPGVTGSRLDPDGTCRSGGAVSLPADGQFLPVTFVATTTFAGPYSIE
jgi:hypothetical protein